MTQECGECGVEPEKLLCASTPVQPAGLETGRNENTGYNVLQRGLSGRGLGRAEVTPAETTLPMSASDELPNIVDARCVVEIGSP